MRRARTDVRSGTEDDTRGTLGTALIHRERRRPGRVDKGLWSIVGERESDKVGAAAAAPSRSERLAPPERRALDAGAQLVVRQEVERERVLRAWAEDAVSATGRPPRRREDRCAGRCGRRRTV